MKARMNTSNHATTGAFRPVRASLHDARQYARMSRLARALTVVVACVSAGCRPPAPPASSQPARGTPDDDLASTNTPLGEQGHPPEEPAVPRQSTAPDEGETRDATQVSHHRLSREELEREVIAWYQSHEGRAEPRDPMLVDLTTQQMWDRLRAQVVRVGMQGYVVHAGQITALGGSFGGMGLRSVCISNSDAEGQAALVFTFSWGSGMHRSEVGAWSPAFPTPGTVYANVGYFGSTDLMVHREGDGRVDLRVGDRSIGWVWVMPLESPGLFIGLDPVFE